MSGICGLFNREGRAATTDSVQAMLGTLRHRGPDGETAWCAGAAALGHSMLHNTPESFIESMPLADTGTGCAITADARLDNRAELMASLSLSGPPDRITDSRLILSAYEKWGGDCPARLLGDFAFAIWDNRRQSVFCATDPMGVKSLYYYLSDRLLVFASEIKALLALPEVPRKLNEVRIAEYLVTLFEDRAGTFYQDILRLPGASTLTVSREKTAVRVYWALDPKHELRLKSDGEYVEAFRELFVDAVRCRLRSAYPVGAALSGGLDSSSIACVARNLNSGANQPLHTFSLVFPSLPEEDRRKIDERPFIQAVLDSGGFVPHSIEADRLSPMRQVERMQFHLDHAVCAPNLYLHWAMYEAAREQGVRVFLDGFDGDAAVSHGFERLTELAQTLRWLSLRREIRLLTTNQLAGIPASRVFRKYCIAPFAPRWAFLAWYWMRGRRREAFSQNVLISSELKRRTQIEKRARALLRPQYGWAPTRSARESHLQSVGQALYSYTLEIADKASSAFQLEARYPFFDRRLLEFCLSLPTEQKLAHGWNRWIQRRAMEGILPPGIQWRARKGNLSPNFHRRLLDFERSRLEEIALSGGGEISPFVDTGAMRSVYREYERSHVRTQGESLQLFAAVNLALWLRASGFASSSASHG